MDFPTSPDPRGLILSALVVVNIVSATILLVAHRRHPDLLVLRLATYRAGALALLSAVIGMIWLSDLYGLDFFSDDVKLGLRFFAMVIISLPSILFLFHYWRNDFDQ